MRSAKALTYGMVATYFATFFCVFRVFFFTGLSFFHSCVTGECGSRWFCLLLLARFVSLAVFFFVLVFVGFGGKRKRVAPFQSFTRCPKPEPANPFGVAFFRRAETR